MQTHYFGEKTWPELKEYAEQNALIILPVGEVEEHTRSLPVDTDSRIAKNLANEIADEIAGEIPVLVLPTVWAGYTPKAVCKWPGAMRVRPQVFTEYVHDICASIAEMGFTKLLMLDCHGQHGPMLNIVTKLIADEYGYYYAVAGPVALSRDEFNAVRESPRGGCSHSGEWEASLDLYYSPELVRPELFTDVDALKHHTKFIGGDACYGGQRVVWSSFGIESPVYGGLGDPTKATAEKGRIIVEAVRKNAREFLMDYYHFKKEQV